MSDMPIQKSIFFDFLNRYSDDTFESFIAEAREDTDYINWHNYCVPMDYGDTEKEYKAVRGSCALFDASPVKKYRISGLDSGKLLDRVMTRRKSLQKSMQVSYAVFCNDDGMLLDDGLLYKFSDDNYLLMISEIDHDDHFMKASLGLDQLKIEEVTPSLSGLALQGPKSCTVLKSMGMTSIENLKPFEIKNYPAENGEITIARVGFTSDLGYELWFKPELRKSVENMICQAETALDMRISGYGLNALNAFRLEGGFIVPGWDTAQTFENNDHERTPSELGIAWTVDYNREDDFVGKKALLKEKKYGPRFNTVGFTMEHKQKPVDGTKLYTTIDGTAVEAGSFPVIAWSYELNCWLGLASVKADYPENEHDFYIIKDGDHVSCNQSSLPFVNFSRYRQTPAPL